MIICKSRYMAGLSAARLSALAGCVGAFGVQFDALATGGSLDWGYANGFGNVNFVADFPSGWSLMGDGVASVWAAAWAKDSTQGGFAIAADGVGSLGSVQVITAIAGMGEHTYANAETYFWTDSFTTPTINSPRGSEQSVKTSSVEFATSATVARFRGTVQLNSSGSIGCELHLRGSLGPRACLGNKPDTGETSPDDVNPNKVLFAFTVNGSTQIKWAQIVNGDYVFFGMNPSVDSSSCNGRTKRFEGDFPFDDVSLGLGEHDVEMLMVAGEESFYDYNGDGIFDCADATEFGNDIGIVAYNALVDFNGDGINDGDDLEIYTKLLQVGFGTGPACLILGDLNGDGCVDTADLGVMLGSFGSCGGGCPADLNGDGVVDTADLGMMLGSFGSGC